MMMLFARIVRKIKFKKPEKKVYRDHSKPIVGYIPRLYSKIDLIRSKRNRRLAWLEKLHEHRLIYMKEALRKEREAKVKLMKDRIVGRRGRRRVIKNIIFYGSLVRKFPRELRRFSKSWLLNLYLSAGNKRYLETDYFPLKEPFKVLDPIHSWLYPHKSLFDFYSKHAQFFRWLQRSLKRDTPDFIYFAAVFFFVTFFFSFFIPFFLSIFPTLLLKFPMFFLNFFYGLFEIIRVSSFLLINFLLPIISSFMVVQLVPEVILLLGIITILLFRAYFYQIYDFSFVKKLLRVAFKDGLVSLDAKSFETRLIGNWVPSFREAYVSNLAWNIFFVSVFFADIWMLFNSADYVYASQYVSNDSGLSLNLTEESFIITSGINDVFFGNHFLYDSYTYYSRFLILTVTLAFLIIFKNELELDPSIRKVEYIVLIMCGLLFSIIMPAASSLISLFLVAEGLVMVMYILSSGSSNRYPSGEGSLKYAILNSVASVMFILGSIFILCADDIYFVNLLNNDKIIVGLVLISLTFLFKIGAFPFHNWMADLYESTSLGILAFFLLIPKLSIILTLINLSRLFFVKFSVFFFVFFFVLGILSFVTGSVLAASQTKITRLLAYSSISQVGSLLVLLSLVILNPSFPISLLFLFTIVYVLVSIQTVFMMNNLRRGTSAISLLSQLKDISLIKFAPKPVQTIFSAFIFNLSGLPPLIGWVLKAVIAFGALLLLFADTDMFLVFDAYNFLIWLSVLIFISSLISIYYSIRLYKISYEVEPTDSFFPMISRNTSILSLTGLFLFCFVNFVGIFIIGYVFSWINYVIF